ncbi:alcohol dehydrogenase catalytic domain-containing protein [Prochlorothrix hollandica]|uniref:alcohol dehydrogenase catalytic domain-containing protein n=1 Tax=Prochlorothrix hollandica TaxID=1223 RepID=UPI00334025D8
MPTPNSRSPVQGNPQNLETMAAIVQSEYGPTAVLRLEQVPKPAIVADHDVLVRVQATSVHAGDWHLMRGEPFLIRLLFGGLLKPQIKTLGTDGAGRVEAVGTASP